MKLPINMTMSPTLRQLVTASVVVAAISTSYMLYNSHLDRETAASIRELDLPIKSAHYGVKKLDRFGRLRRTEQDLVSCASYFDFSGCISNAELHSNCLPLCDASYSSCPGCKTLSDEHDSQKQTAKEKCETRRDAKCPLSFIPGTNRYDHAAVYKCCLSSVPPSAPACLCTFQQEAQTACYKCGNCLTGTCGVKNGNLEDYFGRVNCDGEHSSSPQAEDTSMCCPGQGVLTCDFNDGATPLTCGMTSDGTQYYCDATSSSCVPSDDCPTSQGGYVDDSGNAVCSYGSIAQAPDFEYYGCVDSQPASPFLSHLLSTSGPFTASNCLSACKIDLACSGGVCGIGNFGCYDGPSENLSSTPPVVDKCLDPCQDNTNENCGGDLAMQVWYYNPDVCDS